MKTYKDPQTAFDQAIDSGRLSRNPQSELYASHFMYMGPTVDGLHDAFKNIVTRQYLTVKHTEDCTDANDDTSVFAGHCICKEGVAL